MGYEIGRSILAASDLTEGSDDVVRTAAEVARRTGAALHVVHAFALPPMPPPGAEGMLVDFPDRVSESEAQLARQVERCVPPDVQVGSTRVDIFAAHGAILDRARDVEASLIVVGAHARGRFELGFLGSTAERVLHQAMVPVLVARGEPAFPLRRALAPQDPSQRAGGALAVALCWAASLGERHVAPPLPAVEVELLHVVPRVPGVADPPFRRATVAPGENPEVTRALEDVPRAGDLDLREEVVWGETPQREIVRRAEETGAGMVMLATRAHGAVKRALLGSVASAVTRDAPCPVFLVPPALWLNDDGRREEGETSEEGAAREWLPVG